MSPKSVVGCRGGSRYVEGFLVSCFLGSLVSWLLGFLVSQFLGFLVSNLKNAHFTGAAGGVSIGGRPIVGFGAATRHRS